MPASINPVKNLDMIIESNSCGRKYMDALKTAPNMEQIKNIFEGLILSDTAVTAKISVPIINPAWTAEVILPKSLNFNPISEIRSGNIAFPANQRDVPANCETIINKRICLDFTI
jgi:hypothetical protein